MGSDLDQDALRRAVVAELTGDRDRLLGSLGAAPVIRRTSRVVPTQWSGFHVMNRLDEAQEILRRWPTSTRPKQFGNSMPRYAYDRFDLNAQLETGELDRGMRARNFVRLSASSQEMRRMEEAIQWPSHYLTRDSARANAVNLVSMWGGMHADVRRRARRAGISWYFLRQNYAEGVDLITEGLIRDKVPVS